MKIERELVVARYKEPLTWLHEHKNDIPPVVIYNKSELLFDPAVDTLYLPVRRLPDHVPGNEAHTYLYHVIFNYDALADVTFFLQGNPFDHTPHILHDVMFREITGFDWLVDHWLVCDYNGCPHHCNLPIGRVYEGLFNEPFPMNGLPFVPGAQFAVTRDQVHTFPREYYMDIAYKMEREFKDWYCWSMERLWKRIFTGVI